MPILPFLANQGNEVYNTVNFVGWPSENYPYAYQMSGTNTAGELALLNIHLKWDHGKFMNKFSDAIYHVGSIQTALEMLVLNIHLKWSKHVLEEEELSVPLPYKKSMEGEKWNSQE